MARLDSDFRRRHYFDLEERLSAEIDNSTASFMRSGPVIALALEGVDAIAKVRQIIGSVYLNAAAPGTVRGDFVHQTKVSSGVGGKVVMNLVHASGNADEVKYEVDLRFGGVEQFDYETFVERTAY